MTTPMSDHGMTLIEVVVATGLLLAVAAGLVPVLVQSHRFAAGAELVTAAAVAARSRAESLLAVPWGRDRAAMIPPAPALEPSPPDSLSRDVPGYVDWLDQAGAPVGVDAGPALTRRWAVRVVPASLEARAIEVCVFRWPAGAGLAPVACVSTARVFQP